MNDRAMIRDYEPTRDEGPLRECVVALQEFERTLEPALPKGEAMADAYLAFLFDRCAAAAGRVFVAEVDRAVVGFVGVLAEVPPAEPDEEQAPYAYVSDLVVLPTYRRRGIGRALLDRAEAFARERGARMLRVAVLAKNRPAGELYRSLGFSDYVVQLSKMLSPPPIEHLPTREGYDRWATIYDDEENPLIVLEERHFSALLGPVDGLDVVDLGCGTGRQAVRLVAAGARVTAVDFSDEMVARARAKPGWERVRFLRHDLTRGLPFPDGSFDRVLSCLVLDHLADPSAFFRECRRVCRRDGFVLVSLFHPALMLRGIQARFTDPATGGQVRPASYPHQISDYVLAVVRAGLTVEHMSEHAVDEEMAGRSARAAKYQGWPLLLLMRLRP
jgi:malonyl-CoA O-methyltransferase